MSPLASPVDGDGAEDGGTLESLTRIRFTYGGYDLNSSWASLHTG